MPIDLPLDPPADRGKFKKFGKAGGVSFKATRRRDMSVGLSRSRTTSLETSIDLKEDGTFSVKLPKDPNMNVEWRTLMQPTYETNDTFTIYRDRPHRISYMQNEKTFCSMTLEEEDDDDDAVEYFTKQQQFDVLATSSLSADDLQLIRTPNFDFYTLDGELYTGFDPIHSSLSFSDDSIVFLSNDRGDTMHRAGTTFRFDCTKCMAGLRLTVLTDLFFFALSFHETSTVRVTSNVGAIESLSIDAYEIDDTFGIRLETERVVFLLPTKEIAIELPDEAKSDSSSPSYTIRIATEQGFDDDIQTLANITFDDKKKSDDTIPIPEFVRLVERTFRGTLQGTLAAVTYDAARRRNRSDASNRINWRHAIVGASAGAVHALVSRDETSSDIFQTAMLACAVSELLR